MPGIQAMNSSGVDAARPLKAERSVPQHITETPLVNGGRAIAQLDGTAESRNGVSAELPTAGEVDIPASLLEAAPEIEHITFGYQPLGKLVQRVSQECFNDLLDLLDRLGDMPLPSNASLTNGTGHGSSTVSPEAAAISNKKRLLMLEFAHTHRVRFIKLLVLSRWSRQVEQVGKLIDLFAWLRRQDVLVDEAAHWLGMLRINMAGAKVPNPDIPTALQVLSTGAAPGIPDLGYLPPKPLTPKDTLKLLRNINTILTIRLNLHEDLPFYLRNHTIHSGRATFVCPSQFEFDVSVADEDPTARFYFIDFRLLFQPTTELDDGFLREVIESRCNEALSESGLVGCYDFLNNFVLTHRVSTFRRQALSLSRGTWSNSLRLENCHRVFIVQYWADTPRRKSWVEFGLESGRSKDGRPRFDGSARPKFSMRWMREGVHVQPSNLQLDSTDLSLEQILTQIVAQHTAYILGSLQQKIGLLSASSRPKVKLRQSNTHGNDHTLSIRLQDSTNKTTLGIEPFTGRLHLGPSSSFSQRIGSDLNGLKDPAADGAGRVVMHACIDQQARLERHADMFGWTNLRQLDLQGDQIKKAMGTDFTRASFFRVRGWDPSWLVGLTLSLGGTRWWAIKLANSSTGGSVRAAIPVPVGNAKAKSDPTSSQLLRRVKRLAAAAITFNVAKADLVRKDMAHDFCLETVPAPRDLEVTKVPVLYIRTSDLRNVVASAKSDTVHRHEAFRWYADLVRLSYHGLDAATRQVGLTAKVLMRDKANAAQLMAANRDEDISFRADGSVTFRLRVPFGTSATNQLVDLLASVGRLQGYSATLSRYQLQLTSISDNELSFKYADDHVATVTLPKASPKASPTDSSSSNLTGTTLAQMKLSPGSPQVRISTLLRLRLSHSDPDTGFQEFVRGLVDTHPLLKAFSTIETTHPVPQPMLHPRNTDLMRIAYTDPVCVFDLRLRRCKDEFAWHLSDQGPTKDKRPEVLVTGLRELFRERQRPGVERYGLRGGLVVKAEGLGRALLDLDKAVRSASRKGVLGEAKGEEAQDEGATHAAAAGGAVVAGAASKAGQVKQEVITLD